MEEKPCKQKLLLPAYSIRKTFPIKGLKRSPMVACSAHHRYAMGKSNRDFTSILFWQIRKNLPTLVAEPPRGSSFLTTYNIEQTETID
jgi:hypothetical protein